MMCQALSQAILHTFSYLILREHCEISIMSPTLKLRRQRPLWGTQGSTHSGSAPGTGPSPSLSPAGFNHKPPPHHCTTGSLLSGPLFHGHIRCLCVLLDCFNCFNPQYFFSVTVQKWEFLCGRDCVYFASISQSLSQFPHSGRSH